MTNKIIIRADDLGYSKAVDYGIYETIKNGLINNVGIMTNMPDAERAFNLIKNFDVCLGLHVNICTGFPLSNPSKIKSITTNNGFFIPSKNYRKSKKDIANLEEVTLEIQAQYDRFIEITGKKPSYFEGHAVQSKNFKIGLKRVANREDVAYLDFSLDPDIKTIPFKNTIMYPYMETLNEGFNPYDMLKNASLDEHKDGFSMVVCHPGYLDKYILNHSSVTIPRTEDVEMLTSPKVKKWIISNNIQLIKYSDIK